MIEKILPITTGASESHRVMGIGWPSMNWEAAALKNGSRAKTKDFTMIKLKNYKQNIEFEAMSRKFDHL